jgi:hypothetical protein
MLNGRVCSSSSFIRVTIVDVRIDDDGRVDDSDTLTTKGLYSDPNFLFCDECTVAE